MTTSIALVFPLLLLLQIEITTPDRLLSNDGPGHPLVEPHLAVSPTDADHLLAGAIVAGAVRNDAWHCAAFLSRDRGLSWQRHDFAIERCIDPWALVLPDGSALMAAIAIRSGVEGDARFQLVVFRSDDGGDTWPAEATFSASSYEHPILVAPGDAVYLTARRMRRADDGSPRHAVGVERSTDGGRSFESLAEIRPSDLALNATGLSVHGERITVTFLDFQRNVDGFDREGMLEQPRAWALVSSDGGDSFSEPKLVSESCGMKGGFPGYPFSTAAPRTERVYFTCVRPGFDGLVLHVSEDGGERWSDPFRIDDASPHVRTPMLAVNRDGALGVAWYDRREDPERKCQHLYFTASADAGASFLEPVRISTHVSCPQSEGNGSVADSWPMGGDYTSLASGPDGAFHVVWADSRRGRFELRTATLTVRVDKGEQR